VSSSRPAHRADVDLSLLGLVRHLSARERSWFRRRIAGESIDSLYWSARDPRDGD